MSASTVLDIEQPLDRGDAPVAAAVTAVVETEPPADAAVAVASRSRADHVALVVMALGLWVGLVFLGRVWGLLLELQGRQMVLFTPPLLGSYTDAWDPALTVPIMAAVVLVAGVPVVARRLRWVWACAAAAAANLGWGIALAVIDGNDGLVRGLEFGREYRPYVEQIRSIGAGRWLSGFTASVPGAGIQVRAHPPGTPLLLGGLDRIGLGGPWWAALVVLAVAVSTVPAVLIAVRELAGEDTARAALPFVALAPAVLFVFTSFDALYMGVGAWFVAALVLAVRRPGLVSWGWAVAAGVFAAAAVMGSYGMVLLGLIPLPLAVRDRAWRPVLVAAVTALACVGAFVPYGFWWLEGLGATREAYYALGLDRPYLYFLLAGFSALALVTGPAVAAGLAAGRDRRLWLLFGGAVAAIVVADLSGLSTGEVERIWLPFAVWLVPATAVLARRAAVGRVWLWRCRPPARSSCWGTSGRCGEPPGGADYSDPPG